MTLSAEQLVERLDLIPHPEGGWYRQTWQADTSAHERAPGTCIYFLLKAGEASHWHRVDSAEIWHFYAGDPLILSMAPTSSGPARDLTLGSDLAAGQQPQIIVPPNYWQAARSSGAYSLVGCTVSPGFEFERFELAEPGFDIPRLGTST